MRIRIPGPLAFVAAAAVVACTNPTLVCGCLPPPDLAVVYGRVTVPDGGAAAAATVRVETGPPGCQPFVDGRAATARNDGAFRMQVSVDAGYGPDACRRVFALPPAGSPLRGSDTVPLTVEFRPGPPLDSVRVDLVLRTP